MFVLDHQKAFRTSKRHCTVADIRW